MGSKKYIAAASVQTLLAFVSFLTEYQIYLHTIGLIIKTPFSTNT